MKYCLFFMLLLFCSMDSSDRVLVKELEQRIVDLESYYALFEDNLDSTEIAAAGLAQGVIYRASDTGKFYLADSGGDPVGVATDDEVVYGSHYEYFENSNIITNTTTTNATVLNVTTSVLPVGIYRITPTYNCNSDVTTSDFIFSLTLDGAPLGSFEDIHRKESKDSGGNAGNGVPGTGSFQQYPTSRPYIYEVTAPQAVNLVLSIRSEAAPNESSSWDAIIEVVRVK